MTKVAMIQSKINFKLAELQELSEALDQETLSEPENLKTHFETFRAAYAILFGAVSHAGGQVKTQALTPGEQVDIGFLFREMERLADDFRKDCKQRKELTGKLLCMKVMQDNLTTGKDEDVVKGKMARAECDLRMLPILPKKGTPQYVRLMRFFNVGEDAVDAGLFSVHWNHMSEYLTGLAQQGKAVPQDIVGERPDYRAKFVRTS